MGFDIYGQSGNYFRNNVWWWHPLADYVLDVCDDVLKDNEQESWHMNDGQFVSAETTLAIANRLEGLIEKGATRRYAERYEAEQKATPDEDCKFCAGTGRRPKDENWDPESDWAKKCNGCNSCSGTGKVRPFSCSYPFAEKNVKKFAQFCRESSGFNIH